MLPAFPFMLLAVVIELSVTTKISSNKIDTWLSTNRDKQVRSIDL